MNKFIKLFFYKYNLIYMKDLREHLRSKTKVELVKMAQDFNHLFQIKNAQKLLKMKLIDEFMRYEHLLKKHIEIPNMIKAVKTSIKYKKRREVKQDKNKLEEKLTKKSIQINKKAIKEKDINKKKKLIDESMELMKRVNELTPETRKEKKLRETKRMLRQTPRGQEILKKMEKQERKEKKEERRIRKEKKEKKNAEKTKIKNEIIKLEKELVEIKKTIDELNKDKLSKETKKLMEKLYPHTGKQYRMKLMERYLNYETENKEKIKKLKAKI